MRTNEQTGLEKPFFRIQEIMKREHTGVYVFLRQPQKVYRSDTHTGELRKRHGDVAASIRKVYLHK